MCDKCRQRAAMIPHATITAIEAHKAELIEVLAEINAAANPGETAETTANSNLTAETLALLFAPYVIGYLLGQQNQFSLNTKLTSYDQLGHEGIQAGLDRLHGGLN